MRSSCTSARQGLVLCLLAMWVPAARADWSPEETRLLAVMSSRTAAHCVELAQQADGWRRELQELRREVGPAGQGRDPAAAFERLVRLVQQMRGPIAALPPELRAISQQLQELEQQLQAAQRKWRDAPFNPDDFPDLNEREFREKLRRETQAEAVSQLATHIDQQLLAGVDKLRQPAQYARSFLEGKFRQWTQEPLGAAGDESLVFRIVAPPEHVSIFSPEANLGVEIEYLPQQLAVQATGLYFQPRQGGLPEPRLDRLQVDSRQNLQGMVLNKLQGLGEEITADLGLPLTVTITGLPDFTAGQRPGALPFRLEVGLLEGGTVQAKAENLYLYPGNRVDWGAGRLTIQYPLEPPVPIGTTPLAFWSLEGGYTVKPPELSFRTKISTLASPSQTVHLDVGVTAELPLKKLVIDGHLNVLGAGAMGEVEGEINFSKGIVRGAFRGQGPLPIAAVGMGNGEFELRKEHLQLKAEMQLLGCGVAEMESLFNFEDGSAYLIAGGGLELFGAEFAATFAGEIAAGFERLTIDANGSVRVPGIEPYGTVHASVSVRADTAAPDAVQVVAKTFIPGLDVRFTVPSLADCTLEKLREELQRVAVDAYHQLLKEMAQGEKEVRLLAAQLDSKMRNYVHERLGGAWRTGNPELDALGADLSREWKNAGGQLVDLRDGAAKALVDARKTIQDEGKHAESSVRKAGRKLDPSGWKL